MPDFMLRAMLEIVTFGVGFSLVFALAQLCRKDPDQSNWLYFLVFLGNSFIQLAVALKARGVLQDHPLVFFLSLSSLFFIGPANYLYHHLLLNQGKPVSAALKIPFIPAGAAVLGAALFQFLPWEVKAGYLAEYLGAPLQHWPTVILTLGAVFIFSYFIIMLRLGLSVLTSESIRAQVLILLAAFLSTLLSIGLLYLGFILVSDALLLAGGTLVTLICVVMFLSTMRYPNFYRLIENEIKKARYERSLLKGLDIEVVLERLTYLMGVENIYQDFDLSLESLAQMMSMTPHQLSQFMNERLNTNFRNYINSYRIEEAKKILASDSNKNILAICYDVGFNSKSTFNHWFKIYTNKTPSEFRQEHLSKPADRPDL